MKFAPYNSSIGAFDTPWYYELKAKISEQSNAQMIKVSCLQELKSSAYLYYGILEDFYLDKSGQLDRIVISDAFRRKLEDDDPYNSEQKPEKSRFYQIKGDRLVLKYSTLINLNIEYLYVTEIAADETTNASI